MALIGSISGSSGTNNVTSITGSLDIGHDGETSENADGFIQFVTMSSAPGTPATNYGRLYSRGDPPVLYFKDDAGTETSLLGGGATLAGIDDQTSVNDDQITIKDGEVVINEDQDDLDFRVETDNNDYALFVDGGNEGVGIGIDKAFPGLTVVHDYQTADFETSPFGTDGDFTGDVLRYSPGADDTLTMGQIYFLHTDGTWDATDAGTVATGASQLLGVGLGGSSQTVGVLTKGFMRIPSTEILNLPGDGACDGLPLYVSTTAGHFDFTAPSANPEFVRVVGYAIDDATDVLVYFNPDPTWVSL